MIFICDVIEYGWIQATFEYLKKKKKQNSDFKKTIHRAEKQGGFQFECARIATPKHTTKFFVNGLMGYGPYLYVHMKCEMRNTRTTTAPQMKMLIRNSSVLLFCFLLVRWLDIAEKWKTASFCMYNKKKCCCFIVDVCSCVLCAWKSL